MDNTYDALFRGSAANLAGNNAFTIDEQHALIIDEHKHHRQLILNKLHMILQQKEVNPLDIEELNHMTTDYVVHSQFVVLPPLCSTLAHEHRDYFIDNSVAFSYMTNILAEHPQSRVAVSKLMELFTDRFIYEDEIFGTINRNKMRIN